MKLNTIVIGYKPVANTAVDPSNIWEMQEITCNNRKRRIMMNNLFQVGVRFEGYKNDDEMIGKGYDISYNNDFRYLSAVNSKMDQYTKKVISSDIWSCSMNLTSTIHDYDTLEMFSTPSSFSPSIKVTTKERSETLISILINTDAYQMIKYFSYQKSSIKTTMHLPETAPGRRNSAVGCIMGYPNTIISSEYDDAVFRLIIKSRTTGEVYDLNIYSDNNGGISVANYTPNREEKRCINEILRRRRTDKWASDNFRVESREIETSLILIPEHNDIPLRISTKADRYKCVIEVPDDLLLTNDADKLIQYIDARLPKDKPGRFKACTLVGRLFLPLQTVRHFRWLYVFKYDGDDIITCIKSP